MHWRVLAAGVALAAAAGFAPAGGQPSRTYLTAETTPNDLNLLPPPPAPRSGSLARDKEVSKAALKLRGGPRWDLATQDANLGFPAVAGTFSSPSRIGLNTSFSHGPRAIHFRNQ